MARVIECDRCSNRLKDEADIYRVTFAPMPKTTANTSKTYELCTRCFDYVHRETTQPPPQMMER